MPTEFENPYSAPKMRRENVAANADAEEFEKVKAVAKYQRWIIVCLLAYFAMFAASIALASTPEIRAAIGFAFVVVVLAGAACVFLLALRLYGVVLGLLVGVVSLVPFLGFVMLALMSSRASKLITEHGYHVGFLGANAGQFVLDDELEFLPDA